MKKFNSEEIREFVSKPLFDEKVIFSKDPSWPKISIITPSYNQADFLERTIISVLNQNYPNLEYIIIDGGSTDRSVEIIKKYENYLAYWVSEKDNGTTDGVNKGISMATGHLVGTQNSDDIYLPGAFYKAIEVFNKDPNTDIVLGNRLDVDEKDNIISESRFTPFTVVGHFYEGMALSMQTAFWQKSLFSKIGMFDPKLRLAGDFEFFLRAGLKKARFKHVRYYWGAIRRHKAAKTYITWSPTMKKECEIIDRLYGRKYYLNHPLKIYSLFRRIMYYFLQGDQDYLFKALKKRLSTYRLFRS